MEIYFITQHFKTRRMIYDENENILWLHPNFKERFLKGHQVGFNLNLLRLIEQYPALSPKVAVRTPLVYFTLHLKDLKMAIGVNEKAFEWLNLLEIPDPPSIVGNPIVNRPLK